MNDHPCRAMLRAGQSVIIYPRGVSMRPLVKQGKTCVGLLPLTDEPQIGDILAFIRPSDDANIIHRLVAIDGDTYITRGDNCLGCEYSKRDQIFGVVEWVRTGDKTLRVTDEKYLLYVRFWTRTWGIRRQVFRVRAVWYRVRGCLGRTALGRLAKKVLRR